MTTEFITNQYGFIVDYLAEFLHEMRVNETFRCNSTSSLRSEIISINVTLLRLKRTVSGLLKLIYPNGDFYS